MRIALAATFLALTIGEAASADVVLSLNLAVNSAADGSGTDYGSIVGTISFADATLASMTHWDLTYTPTANSIAPAFTFTDPMINTSTEYESGTYTQDYTFTSQVQPYSEFFFQYVNYQDHYNYTLNLATPPGVTLVDGTNTFNRAGASSDVDFQYQTGTGPHGNLMTTYGDVLGTLSPLVAAPEPSTLVSAIGGAVLLLIASARARRKARQCPQPGIAGPAVG